MIAKLDKLRLEAASVDGKIAFEIAIGEICVAISQMKIPKEHIREVMVGLEIVLGRSSSPITRECILTLVEGLGEELGKY